MLEIKLERSLLSDEQYECICMSVHVYVYLWDEKDFHFQNQRNNVRELIMLISDLKQPLLEILLASFRKTQFYFNINIYKTNPDLVPLQILRKVSFNSYCFGICIRD